MNRRITFDRIHTTKKQQLLQEMMTRACSEALKIGNSSIKSNYCPICHNDKIKYFTEKYGFHLSRCSHCEQIFCNPMPSKSQLEYFYNSEMKDFENEFFMESFEDRIPIFEERIDIIKEFVPSGNLLDVGSAIGIFLTALTRQPNSYKLFSCDPSKSACSTLKDSIPDIELYPCMVEDLELHSHFDAITMWDTLEHVTDPLLVSKKINSLLKKDGYWFFSTPNTHSFEWLTAEDQHVQILPPGHINLFNPTSIKILLEQTGFDLIETHTLNGTLDVSYIKKQLNISKIFNDNIGLYLGHHLNRQEFSDSFADFLVKTKTAGNVFAIAKKR
ncbi:class I SAM-dependent methyltransferase [Aeromonas dhakensis]|uniref:class I SAM-dependent methyltransferase n=1 Tax=Aeromonas dhakensis TaxID=196024 RepID=UPI003B9FDB67